jgi:aldose 1-epimerase
MSVLIIEELPFGRIRDIEVKLFKLKNKNEFELNLISFGATIQSIKVKDKNNVLTDVSLGFDNIEGLFNF